MSHGAIPTTIDAAIDMSAVIKLYPALRQLYSNFMGYTEQFDLTRAAMNFQFCGNGMDEELHNQVDWPAEMSEEAVDSMIDQIIAAYDGLCRAFKKETGLSLGVTYADSPEDSYADVGDEWVWFLEDSSVRKETPAARRFRKRGGAYRPVQWCVYG